MSALRWTSKSLRNLVNQLKELGHDVGVSTVRRLLVEQGYSPNPYGAYDIGLNNAWVSVGIDHDTAEFAVESIRRWWHMMGKELYPAATRLLITADGWTSSAAAASARS